MNKDLASDLVKSNGMVLLSSSDDDGTVEGIELSNYILFKFLILFRWPNSL